MKDIVRDTVAEIRKRGIIPESRSSYLIRNYLVWAALVAVVFLGALSFSVAYSLLSELDWDLYRFMRLDPVTYALSIFPYFWAVLIVVLLAVAFADIRRTETGYRFSRSKIVFSIVGGVVFLGAAMSFFGIGDAFGTMMTKGFPYYGRHLVVTKEAQWMRPDSGLLSGTIESIDVAAIGLTDLDGGRWEVLVDGETEIRLASVMERGSKIKLTGDRIGEYVFRATEIRPWGGHGAMDGNGMGQGHGATSENGSHGRARTAE